MPSTVTSTIDVSIDSVADKHNLRSEDENQDNVAAKSPTENIPQKTSAPDGMNRTMVSTLKPPDFVRQTIYKEISSQVIRCKLSKLRHLVLNEAISKDYLDNLFPLMLPLFAPQTVHYNGGIANIKEWKISCYLEVMDGGVPTAEPNLPLLGLFRPLLDACNDLFLFWYKQQHACSGSARFTGKAKPAKSCKRLMTFLTRYTAHPGEQALLKHVDGAGKVDGSVVVALPIDRWSAPEHENAFEGGGLTFWDGREWKQTSGGIQESQRGGKSDVMGPREIHYDTRSGDIAFIDRAVWHQADPITKGTRWALVIFYEVER